MRRHSYAQNAQDLLLRQAAESPDQLERNFLLRHDLNFDTKIQGQPKTHGLRGEHRSGNTTHLSPKHPQLGKGQPEVSLPWRAEQLKHLDDTSLEQHDEYSGNTLDLEPELLLQPETRPISHEQLVVEVKGIYAGLVMVEAKCIEIDERQSVVNHGKDASKILGGQDHRRPRMNKMFSKVKRGLSGFMNGTRVSALPDTGSKRNIVSESFAREMKLEIEGSPATFLLGNSSLKRSLGTVSVEWAFSESPKDVSKINCDVLPGGIYNVMLGSQFLAATQTLSRYRRRVTECIFSVVNALQFNFLGNTSQRLLGTLSRNTREAIAVSAVPDTGAEGNIMSESFAITYGMHVQGGPARCNTIQFADGTCQDTIGQVEAFWTFDSGERTPVIFEVLEDCCSDLILGESILYDHNVFEDHASSIVTVESSLDAYQLAPFDFIKNWQRRISGQTDRSRVAKASEDGIQRQPDSLHLAEEERREAWDCRYTFGETADEAEKSAEQQRRETYDVTRPRLPRVPPRGDRQQADMLRVPSIASASNSAPHLHNPTRPPS